MANDSTVVFLHGAGTGAWIWERVMRDLPMSGIALDVPGRKAGVTPDSCAAELIAELDARGIGAVVCVLHSLAGVLAPGLSTRLGSRLRSCVFLSAVIPPSGGALIDTLGVMHRLILRTLFTFNPGGLKPSAAMIRRTLCADLGEQDARLVVSRYQAEMPGLYLESAGAAPALARCAYVKLLKDRSITPSQQDVMMRRLENCRVHEIDAGHLAMLSAPAEVLEVLLQEASST